MNGCNTRSSSSWCRGTSTLTLYSCSRHLIHTSADIDLSPPLLFVGEREKTKETPRTTKDDSDRRLCYSCFSYSPEKEKRRWRKPCIGCALCSCVLITPTPRSSHFITFFLHSAAATSSRITRKNPTNRYPAVMERLWSISHQRERERYQEIV